MTHLMCFTFFLTNRIIIVCMLVLPSILSCAELIRELWTGIRNNIRHVNNTRCTFDWLRKHYNLSQSITSSRLILYNVS